MLDFLLKSRLYSLIEGKEEEIVFELMHGEMKYRSTRRNGRWLGYPSNAFVKYGMRLKKIMPIFDKEPNVYFYFLYCSIIPSLSIIDSTTCLRFSPKVSSSG